MASSAANTSVMRRRLRCILPSLCRPTIRSGGHSRLSQSDDNRRLLALARAGRSSGSRALQAPPAELPYGTDAPTVELRDLHVTLRRDRQAIRALRGVDLEIGRGEILGLVGESGAGKSILGLAVLGLLPTESSPEITGTVTVAGVNMLAAKKAELRELRRRHVGAVFQDPMTSLDPTMRIGTQIIEIAGSARAALELLEAVGVPAARRRLRAYPHELSGGLRQRVMIAMAIAGEPSLVVADEPTTALDVTIQAQILELLSKLRGELGLSVLLITHDLAVASQIADRIAVLYGGRIAELAETGLLLREPQHPYTAALLRSRLDVEMDKSRPVPTLDGEPPDPRDPPPGCPFEARCVFAQPQCAAGLPELRGAAGHRNACIRSEEIDLRPKAVEIEPWEPPNVERETGAVLVAEDLEVEARPRGLRRGGGVRILRGVDLTLAAGEALALVGESGSGKTTLLRTAAGLMSSHAGTLQLADDAPQMVFQDAGASLTPWLTVGELLEDRLRSMKLSREQRRKRVAHALESVGLPAQVLAVRPAQLSGGQRQRVALARAVVVPPAVLLCDEPTSALDVSVAANVLNLIGRLRRDLGMAVVFVTHDLAIARLIADRIAVMYLGRIVECGPAEQVIAQPAHPYTRALIASLPGPSATTIKLAGEPPNLYAPPSGCPFHPRCLQALDSCAERQSHFVYLQHAPEHGVDCVLAGQD
jgi:peptide/nickel transport system ATP-binding protein